MGDGLPANRTIRRRHFASEAILDFVHALSYGFAAAFAGRPSAEGVAVYRRWLQAVWSGRVATILPKLEGHAAALGRRRSAPRAILGSWTSRRGVT